MPEDQTTNQPPTEEENVISDYYEGMKQLEMQDHESGIRKARNALFLTAALLFIAEMIAIATSELGFHPLLVGIAIVEAGLFVALGFWTKSKPYSAIIVGLVLFALIWMLGIYTAGVQGLFGGMLFRIIVIVYLVKALKPAKAWEDLKKQQ